GIYETPWIEAANRHIGARSLPVLGDQLWHLADESRWPRALDSPVLGPYWRLLERSLTMARDAGCKVLLTGDAGDQLWMGGRDWMLDLVSSGHLIAAGIGLARAALLEARRVP